MLLTTDERTILEFLIRQGYTDVRIVGDRWVAVQELLIGNGRIVSGAMATAIDGLEQEWMYDSPINARLALSRWSGTGGEPQGWLRHKPSNRRRTYDTEGNYVETVRP